MEEKIKKLGDSFRGLWRSYRLQNNDIVLDKWCVTFIYKNQYVETPDADTPEEALDFALNKILL